MKFSLFLRNSLSTWWRVGIVAFFVFWDVKKLFFFNYYFRYSKDLSWMLFSLKLFVAFKFTLICFWFVLFNKSTGHQKWVCLFILSQPSVILLVHTNFVTTSILIFLYNPQANISRFVDRKCLNVHMLMTDSSSVTYQCHLDTFDFY